MAMSSARKYHFDDELRIWVTPFHNPSTYSDGDAVEAGLLATLRKCQDVSAMSEELQNHIVDWPTEYHFSPARHNILRPFSLGPKDCILELGCGCGAMTRYLGESGATVVAVEGSRRRAVIAAERCRDLPNVTIYCEDLLHFQSAAQFSHVTLIGVLEYARVFISGLSPELQCLQSAVRWLNDGGQLLLAIENKFGLKYFNGCAEDHVDVVGFGIHDLYNSDSPVTFGHHELQQLISQAGLTAQDWIYPFPDYKLATHLVHSRAVNHTGFAIGDLLYNSCARDYGGRQNRSFHEGMVWRGLARNHMLPLLANSFLVIARKSLPQSTEINWLATSVNLKRRAAFCTQTTFLAEPNGAIDVRKHLLIAADTAPSASSTGGLTHTPAEHARYENGLLHAAEFQRQAARARSMYDLHPWLLQWLKYLRVEQLRAGLESTHLPGHMVDAVPGNLIGDTSGNLRLIDIEWRMERSIPMSWVLIRGMVNTLSLSPPAATWQNLTFQQATVDFMGLVDVFLGPEDFLQASQLDASFQRLVQPPFSRSMPLAETLSSRVHTHCIDLSSGRGERALQNEIDRIKATWSWRLTSPFRALANLLRLL